MAGKVINLHEISMITALHGTSVACKRYNAATLEHVTGDIFNANFLIITIVESGLLHYETHGRRGILKKGSVIISAPMSQVRYLACSSDYSSFTLFIEPKYYTSLLEREAKLAEYFTKETLLACPTFVIEDEKRLQLSQIFIALEKAISGKHRLKDELVRNILNVFLILLGEDIASEDIYTGEYMRKDNIYRIFVHNAGRYFRSERQLSFYADLQNISSDYLSRVVKEVSGNTPSEYIASLLYNEICHQLFTSDRTINEIALDLNFSDQSALTKFFKQRSGMSPLAYRRQNLYA